ncbi:hypothetical protein TrVE_jg12878 [Triparma verrucosa]|uniref:Uncharacterized protein n=1 Tax=Triparma verrucosa TaxID=1606542 RepID=A0A9W7FEH8_9STRA|nr:hypothetical protein TrVE_jg12878 [Triparma verrucosa]
MTQAYKKQSVPPSRSGKTSRGMGVSYLTTLTSQERQKDLTEIQKFSITSSNYTLQLHRHLQNLITHGPIQPYDPDYMIYRETGGRRKPVESKAKLPPEEERRLSQKRKNLSRAESTRENLETQYMSLRFHYVSASQRLATSRLSTDNVCKVLMGVGERRGRGLGYRRVRMGVAREIKKVIEERLKKIQGEIIEPQTEGTAELTTVWDNIENTLVAAEQACWDKELSGIVQESLKGNFKKEDGALRKNNPRQPLKSQVKAAKPPILWENSIEPPVPRGLPLLLTPLSSDPMKACASSYATIFGSSASSLTWLETGMPNSTLVRESELDSLAMIKAECAALTEKATSLRLSTLKTQAETSLHRSNTQSLNSRLQFLRTETEAILSRHQLVVDSSNTSRQSSTLEYAFARSLTAQELANSASAQPDSDSEEEPEIASTTQSGFMSGSKKASNSPKGPSSNQEDGMMELLARASEGKDDVEEEEEGGEKRKRVKGKGEEKKRQRRR